MSAILTCVILYGVGFFCFYFSSDRPVNIEKQIKEEIRQEQVEIEKLKKGEEEKK
jgi:hypothetical protein